jgi:hypothetical protein
MSHGLSDTHPDAERVMIAGYRNMPASRKWEILGASYRFARSLHATGFRLRNPGADDAAMLREWMGFESQLPPEVPVNPSQEDFQPGLAKVLDVFAKFGIEYAIGGSLASSLHGVGRMTWDADISVEPFRGREAAFAADFDPSEFYLSLPAIQEANRDRSTFNLIHLLSGYKVDVFVRKDEPFEQSAFKRRVCEAIPNFPAPILTPEDTVLFKARTYRRGANPADVQWNDIQGVLKVQAERLDRDYLARWAAELGVEHLLDKAVAEAGV